MSARLVHVEVRFRCWMRRPKAVARLVEWVAESLRKKAKMPFEVTLILNARSQAWGVNSWAAVGWRRRQHIS